MATAQKTTIETVTSEDVITLTLSQDEAQVLCRILGHVLGHGKLRKEANSMFLALAPVTSDIVYSRSPWEDQVNPRLKAEI